MNYQLNTHCPNCFHTSQRSVCPQCQFDRDDYLNREAANHHLPLFTKLTGNMTYIIGRVLGEGGFAIVYAALREQDGLAFALKEYYPEALASRGLNGCSVQPKRSEGERLALWRRRFKEEAEHLRRCQDHPAIPGVVRRADLIEQNNTVYLVMERLQGKSLREYFTEPKPAQWILGWLTPLLDTFAQLHERHIFHRDISPNNVFLTTENKPVLMDFGLAREGIRCSVLKSSTVGAGTEGFIAPEQTMMESASNRVDARTDLYSVGGLIYMALHGELPPSAAQRAQGAPLKHCKNADNMTAQLEKLALHCMALDRKKRPENVAAIKKQYALLRQMPILEKTLIPDLSSQQQKSAELNSPTQSRLSFKKSLPIFSFVIFSGLVVYYGNINVLIAETKSFYHKIDYAGAIKKYKISFNINQKKSGIYKNRGAALSNKVSNNSAIENYKKAIELNPKYVDGYYNLGYILFAQGDKDGAIKMYKKVIELNPNDADAYNGWGEALLAKGDANGAIEKYKKAAELNPDDTGVYNKIGLTLYKQKKYSEAAIIFAKALEKFPYNLGLLSSDLEMALVQNDMLRFQKRLKSISPLLKLQDKDYYAIVPFLSYLAYPQQGYQTVVNAIEQVDKDFKTNWDFSDMQPAIQRQNQDIQKNARLFIDYFEKRLDLKTLKSKLAE